MPIDSHNKCGLIGGWLSLILFTILIITSNCPAYAESLRTGTLIVLVPLVDGVLVCADKKSLERSDVVKIYPIGNSGFFTVNGIHAISADKSEVFNAETIMKGLLLKDAHINKQRLEQFKEALRVAFMPWLEYVKNQNYEGMKDQPSGITLFEVNIIYRGNDQTLRNGYIVAKYVKTASPQVAFATSDTPMELRVQVLGWNDLAQRIITGEDTRFPMLQRFLSGSYSNEEATPEGAYNFAKSLIEISSAEDTSGRISKECDCAIFGPNTPFTWLNRTVATSVPSAMLNEQPRATKNSFTLGWIGIALTSGILTSVAWLMIRRRSKQNKKRDMHSRTRSKKSRKIRPNDKR